MKIHSSLTPNNLEWLACAQKQADDIRAAKNRAMPASERKKATAIERAAKILEKAKVEFYLSATPKENGTHWMFYRCDLHSNETMRADYEEFAKRVLERVGKDFPLHRRKGLDFHKRPYIFTPINQESPTCLLLLKPRLKPTSSAPAPPT